MISRCNLFPKACILISFYTVYFPPNPSSLCCLLHKTRVIFLLHFWWCDLPRRLPRLALSPNVWQKNGLVHFGRCLFPENRFFPGTLRFAGKFGGTKLASHTTFCRGGMNTGSHRDKRHTSPVRWVMRAHLNWTLWHWPGKCCWPTVVNVAEPEVR